MPKDLKFYRWVPRPFAEAAHRTGFFTHNASALWIFQMSQPYRPGQSISGTNSKPSVLLRYEFDEKGYDWITDGTKEIWARGNGREEAWPNHKKYAERKRGEGEASFPWQIITKSNETGAYGIGRHRQSTFNLHCKTHYANKKEVANALGRSEMEVGNEWKPPGHSTWPT